MDYMSFKMTLAKLLELAKEWSRALGYVALPLWCS